MRAICAKYRTLHSVIKSEARILTVVRQVSKSEIQMTETPSQDGVCEIRVHPVSEEIDYFSAFSVLSVANLIG